MKTLVVDASVAAKWVLPEKDEPLRDEALEILNRYTEGRIKLAVPDFFWIEMGNVLWKAVVRQRCTEEYAQNSWGMLRTLDLVGIASEPLMESASQISFQYIRTVYDCIYVAAAQRMQGEMITADEKLANALGGFLPVKWLGASLTS